MLKNQASHRRVESTISVQRVEGHQSRPTENYSHSQSTAEHGHANRFNDRTKTADLSTEIIDKLYRQSDTITGFARRLLMHLFDKSELLKCTNLYGTKSPRFRKRGLLPDCEGGLDPTRVSIIKKLVEERSHRKNVWKLCAHALNKRIIESKDLALKDSK